MEHANDPNDRTTLRDRVQRLRLPNTVEAGAGGSRAWIPWTLCAVLALVTVALVLRGSGGQASVPEAKPPVSAAELEAVAEPGAVVLESKGYIIPAHQIQVSPKVGGMVVELNIEEGRTVKKGDVLAVIEKANYQAAYDRAKSTVALMREKHAEMQNGYLKEEIESAKAAFDEAKAQRDQLYLDWRRNVTLKSGSALAARDYELAESAFKAQERRMRKLDADYRLLARGYREERVQQAGAEVGQAQADLDNAKWNLDNCTVVAPIDGTILTKKAERWNIVNPIAFNVSASLCDMADLSDLEVDLTIQERDVSVVRRGQECRIRSEAFPGRSYRGEVSRLMPIADRAKGAVPVRVRLLDVKREDAGVYLKPEMGVIVSFLK